MRGLTLQIAFVFLAFFSTPYAVAQEKHSDKLDFSGLLSVHELDTLKNPKFVGSAFFAGYDSAGFGTVVTAAHLLFTSEGIQKTSLLRDSYRFVYGGANFDINTAFVPTGVVACALSDIDALQSRDICFIQVKVARHDVLNSLNLSCPPLKDGTKLTVTGYYNEGGSPSRLLPIPVVVSAEILGETTVPELGGVTLENAYIKTTGITQSGLSGAPIYSEDGSVVGVHAGRNFTQFFSPFAGMKDLAYPKAGLVFSSQDCLDQKSSAASVAEAASEELELDLEKLVNLRDAAGNPETNLEFSSVELRLEIESEDISSGISDYRSVQLFGSSYSGEDRIVDIDEKIEVPGENSNLRLAMITTVDKADSVTYREVPWHSQSDWVRSPRVRLLHPVRFMREFRTSVDSLSKEIVRCQNKSSCRRSSRRVRLSNELAIASAEYNHWISKHLDELADVSECCTRSANSILSQIRILSYAADSFSQTGNTVEAHLVYADVFELLHQLDLKLPEKLTLDSGRKLEVSDKNLKFLVDLFRYYADNLRKVLEIPSEAVTFLPWYQDKSLFDLLRGENVLWHALTPLQKQEISDRTAKGFVLSVVDQMSTNATRAAVGQSSSAAFITTAKYCSDSRLCQIELLRLSEVKFSGNNLSDYIDGAKVDTCGALASLFDAVGQFSDMSVCTENVELLPRCGESAAFEDGLRLVESFRDEFANADVGISGSQSNPFQIVFGEDGKLALIQSGTAIFREQPSSTYTPDDFTEVWGGIQIVQPTRGEALFR